MIAPNQKVPDPIKFAKLLWPHINFYKEQREIIYSVWNNSETIVPAANMMGKDFVSAAIVIMFFLTRTPCRIVTTSAKDEHLKVLWGEMKRFIQESKYPLDEKEGGPLLVNHREIRKKVNGSFCPLSYVTGMVASSDSMASMQGHHVADIGDGVPRTLAVIDESSSSKDDYYKMMKTWCSSLLAIGNTWPCSNFFYRSIMGDPGNNDPGGDRWSEDGTKCYRRVIHIRADQSPNVRYALKEQERGKEPSGKVIIPGVLPWAKYVERRETWDKIRQTVSLDAEFYRGAEVLLFPPETLNAANQAADILTGRRKGLTMGVDPAEGGDDTVWTIIDNQGVIEQVSEKTPDTNIITGRTIALMNEYSVPANKVFFDRGGGGKQHADRLRAQGYAVESVAFGEAVKPANRFERRMKFRGERVEAEEDRYVYKNRRAEMFHMASLLLESSEELGQFAIPSRFTELRRQLAPIPKLFDEEGRLYLPPKRKRDEKDTRDTLEDLIGCSPDEADSFVLAVYGLKAKSKKFVIKSI